MDDRCSRGVVRKHGVYGGDVFFSPGNSLDHTATVISDYIAFCEDMIIPKKLVKSFPNSKPWIAKELKETASQERDAYLKKDREEVTRTRLNLTDRYVMQRQNTRT